MITRNNFIVQEQKETKLPPDLAPGKYMPKGALFF